MLLRRDFLRGAALGPLVFTTAASASARQDFPTPKTVSVVVDFSPAYLDAAADPMPKLSPAPSPSSAPLTAWGKWAGFAADSDSGENRENAPATRTLAASPPGLMVARAVRNAQTRRVGVVLANTSGEPVNVRLETRLGSGLWRVEAAAMQAGSEENAAAKTWRMESVLRSAAGGVVKTLLVRAGQTLFLRFGETISEAEQALRRLQARTASVGVTTYSGESVPGALLRVAEVLSVLPTLVEKNNRPEITKRVHRALLTVAQAEAMAQNAQQAQIDEPDAAFDALTLALSEISCGAWNLVPRQSLEAGINGGPPVLRVSVTNGGTRTLPLVSLAVEGISGGEAKNARPVFRSVAPGATVSARFVLRDGDENAARGIAQFIVGMGAASVYAQPTAAPVAAVAANAEGSAAP